MFAETLAGFVSNYFLCTGLIINSAPCCSMKALCLSSDAILFGTRFSGAAFVTVSTGDAV